MAEPQRIYALLTQNVGYFLEHMEVLFLHVGKHRFEYRILQVDISNSEIREYFGLFVDLLS